MNKVLTRTMVSVLLSVGTLGAAVAVTAPAGAAAKAHKAKAVAAKSYSGKIKTSDVKKDTFTLTSGAKTYVVDFTAKTKFLKGSAADLKPRVTVVVSGSLAKTVIHATTIRA